MKKHFYSGKTFFAIVAIIAGAHFNSGAQTMFLSWAHSAGGTAADAANAVTTDGSGNVYTTGVFRGTVDFNPDTATANLTSVGSSDIFVMKSDAAGNFVWAVAAGGAGADGGNSIAVDAAGNVFVTGSFTGTADFDPGAGVYNLVAGNVDGAFVLKLNPSSTFAWAGKVTGNMDVNGNGIVLDNNMDVVVTGNFGGTADFNPGAGTANLSAAGSNDPFILKLDSTGVYVWAKEFSGSGSDIGTSIAIDGSGAIYTTGYFSGTTDFDPGAGTQNLTASNADIFVSKLDASGAYQWAKSMGGGGSDVGTSIDVDANGNVLTTGSFDGTADFDPGAGSYTFSTSAGISDVFVSKLDASGNFLWAAHMGGTSVDAGHDIWVDNTGDIFITGKFAGTADFDPDTTVASMTSSGGYDLFISKLSSGGLYIYSGKVSGAGSEYGNSICLDNSSNVIIAGNFTGTADFDPTGASYPLASAGIDDICVLKLIQSGVGIENNQSVNSNVFPNPSNGMTTIISDQTFTNATLQIISISGQIVLEKNGVSGNTIAVDFSEQPAGIYFAVIHDGKTITRTKLIKQ